MCDVRCGVLTLAFGGLRSFFLLGSSRDLLPPYPSRFRGPGESVQIDGVYCFVLNKKKKTRLSVLIMKIGLDAGLLLIVSILQTV